ncbi:MAG: hypothetical protein AUK06_01330 [Parcubacteria group bacterium CG2_30_36_18]|nr:MAG: hypothetical protein AUK06_01330 [Parcubacteria group bacterium CG2_30_36_18]
MNLLIQLDVQLFLLINHLQNRFLDALVLGINWITEGGLLWLLICFFILIFCKKEKKRKIILILITLLINSWLVNVPLKLFLFRTRPNEAIEGVKILGKIWSNNSFPSGHIAASVAALLILAYLFRIRQRWFIFSSITFILFSGFARVYVGMHYPTDVLGGIIVGLVSSAVIIWLDKQVKFPEEKNEFG